MQPLGEMPGAVMVFVVAHAVTELFPGMALVGEKNVVVVDCAKLRTAFLSQEARRQNQSCPGADIHAVCPPLTPGSHLLESSSPT